MLICYE